MMRNLFHRLSTVIAAVALASGFGAQASVSFSALADEAQVHGQERGFSTVDSAQLDAMLGSKDFFFVNVHVPYEGEIEDTDANIPFDQIADHLDKLPADRNAGIVLYCRSGRMSETAAAELSRLGYTNVSHLAGGMIEWEESGHEIIKT